MTANAPYRRGLRPQRVWTGALLVLASGAQAGAVDDWHRLAVHMAAAHSAAGHSALRTVALVDAAMREALAHPAGEPAGTEPLAAAGALPRAALPCERAAAPPQPAASPPQPAATLPQPARASRDQPADSACDALAAAAAAHQILVRAFPAQSAVLAQRLQALMHRAVPASGRSSPTVIVATQRAALVWALRGEPVAVLAAAGQSAVGPGARVASAAALRSPTWRPALARAHELAADSQLAAWVAEQRVALGGGRRTFAEAGLAVSDPRTAGRSVMRLPR